MGTMIQDPVVVGRCATMCPAREIQMRESNKLLHPFEVLYTRGRGRRQVRAAPDRAVKEFSRPAAGKESSGPCDLRPPPVLLSTVQYLLANIVPKQHCPWNKVYEFVFDRLRAVRQDMVMQQVGGRPAVHILERTVSFLTYANYRLCTEGLPEYDGKINECQLQECLKWLLCLYESDGCCHCNATQFTALYLLFNLGSGEAILYGLQQKPKLHGNAVYDKALAISLACWRGNYVRVFRLAKDLPVLMLCAMHRHFTALDRRALQLMSVAYTSRSAKCQFQMHELRSLLQLGTAQQASQVCQSLGVAVGEDEAITFTKASFNASAKNSPYHLRWIDGKLDFEDLPSVLTGSPCLCSPV